jgi:hypothetical protein
MKTQKLIFLFFILLIANICRSQYIDSATLNKLMNQNDLPYLDDKGHSIGDKPMEASPIKVVFYSFYLNKSENKAIINGRIIDPSIIDDSVGIRNYIFLATLVGNKLTKIRTLGPSYGRRSPDFHEDKFPYRDGDFKIEFKFNRNERLFFNGELTFPIEFNIGRLLIQK